MHPWLEFYFNVSVLSTTTGLFCIFMLNIHSFGDGLFVGNLRRTYVGLHLELTEQTVNDDFQMQLTHTGDDGLSGLRIGMRTEGGILLCQFGKRLAQLALSCFRLGLDSQLNNRLRELHGLQDYRMLLITDGITCSTELESDSGSNVTGIYFIQLHTFVGVHLQDTSNTLFLALVAFNT